MPLIFPIICWTNFNYEAYGRDVRINEDGGFFPTGGYVVGSGSQFVEHYHGREDIPAEHKVFAYPQLSIREQMAAFKEVIDRFPRGGRTAPPGARPYRPIAALLDTLSRGAFFHRKEGSG